MLQSLWTEQGIVLKDVEPPALQDGWVRLKIHACGICGSDLHGYKDGKIRAGGKPGHEMSGTIMESTVDLPDELYAVEPWLWCGECEFCRIGKVQLCRKAGLVGASVPGGLADFIDVPAMHVYPSDPSLTPIEASLTEPFGICTRAVHLADLKMDTRVLILGAGSLGLISGLLARDTAERVAISYRYPSQAAAAAKLGLEAVPEERGGRVGAGLRSGRHHRDRRRARQHDGAGDGCLPARMDASWYWACSLRTRRWTCAR